MNCESDRDYVERLLLVESDRLSAGLEVAARALCDGTDTYAIPPGVHPFDSESFWSPERVTQASDDGVMFAASLLRRNGL